MESQAKKEEKTMFRKETSPSEHFTPLENKKEKANHSKCEKKKEKENQIKAERKRSKEIKNKRKVHFD